MLEPEGKKVRISAVVMVTSKRARKERRDERHGTAVVDPHLQLRPLLAVLAQSSKGSKLVAALLAVHERVWGWCWGSGLR